VLRARQEPASDTLTKDLSPRLRFGAARRAQAQAQVRAAAR